MAKKPFPVTVTVPDSSFGGTATATVVGTLPTGTCFVHFWFIPANSPDGYVPTEWTAIEGGGASCGIYAPYWSSGPAQGFAQVDQYTNGKQLILSSIVQFSVSA